MDFRSINLPLCRQKKMAVLISNLARSTVALWSFATATARIFAKNVSVKEIISLFFVIVQPCHFFKILKIQCQDELWQKSNVETRRHEQINSYWNTGSMQFFDFFPVKKHFFFLFLATWSLSDLRKLGLDCFYIQLKQPKWNERQ